jgi:Fe-S oxidoreductase
MADRVLAEASSTGASVVATTCPVTKTTLLDAQTPGPKPRDLVELVADALVG